MLFGVACPALHGQNVWTINAPAPSTLTLSVSDQYAGSINSVNLDGFEFVNNSDHGRQISSAISFNGEGECYNPTEGGSLRDDYWSASELLGLSIPSGNRVMTTTDMAYWMVTGDSGNGCNSPVPSANPPGFVEFVFQKDVTISPPGLPANVIEYLSTFHPSWNTPPEPVTSSAAEAPVAYLKYPEFSEVWTYDLATRNLLQNQEPQGEDDMVKVLRYPDGGLAFALYSPENVQPYEGSGFRWWVGADNSTSLVGTLNRTIKPLPLSYRAYMAVGSLTSVMSSLDSLDLKFSSLDPDVFSWREYLRLNPDLGPYVPQADPQGWLQWHWLSNGIAEGRAASYRFASVPYRDLNSDQWGKSYQGVIDHFIQYGRKEARTTAPRPQGGIQHTIVRSPQPDFVPVRASGSNFSGQLGNGTTTGTSSPVQLPHFGGEQRPTDVAAGAYTSLAVLADGTVWMWGSNTYGARGDGSAGGQFNSPVQVPIPFPVGVTAVVPSTKDRHVVASGLSACAVVDNTGKVWTWGANWEGQLGDGTTNPRYTPGTVKKDASSDLTGIVSISIGQSQMVALDIDGHVWTWGWNQYGALGNNSTANSSYAVQVLAPVYDCQVCAPDPNRPANAACPVPLPCYKPLSGMTQVVAGGASFCMALGRDGVIRAWGNNGCGQLGNGDTTARTVATPVAIPSYFGDQFPIPGGPNERNYIDKIAAGSYHALAHSRSDGKVYVWGNNSWGQLGLPQPAPVNQPWPTPMVESEATTNIIDVAAGYYFSLLVRAKPYETSERKIFGVGDNQSGQLGVNDYVTHNQPIETNF